GINDETAMILSRHSSRHDLPGIAADYWVAIELAPSSRGAGTQFSHGTGWPFLGDDGLMIALRSIRSTRTNTAYGYWYTYLETAYGASRMSTSADIEPCSSAGQRTTGINPCPSVVPSGTHTHTHLHLLVHTLNGNGEWLPGECEETGERTGQGSISAADDDDDYARWLLKQRAIMRVGLQSKTAAGTLARTPRPQIMSSYLTHPGLASNDIMIQDAMSEATFLMLVRRRVWPGGDLGEARGGQTAYCLCLLAPSRLSQTPRCTLTGQKMASAMASPYSVPHSRSTLGVKVLQPMLMLFSPEAGVGSRSLDATSQQSSLSSQARLARVSSGTNAWCLTLALLRSWNCQLGGVS
ncbi:LOW QUALITY PROTEIN: hypothetical protein N5P37_002589, partial [Trichoderma harzianum]